MPVTVGLFLSEVGLFFIDNRSLLNLVHTAVLENPIMLKFMRVFYSLISLFQVSFRSHLTRVHTAASTIHLTLIGLF